MLIRIVLSLIALAIGVAPTRAQIPGDFAPGTIFGNPGAIFQPGRVSTASDVLDRAFSSTPGAVMIRGSSSWGASLSPSITNASASLTYTNSLWDFRIRNGSASNLGALLDMQLGKPGTAWTVPGQFAAAVTLETLMNVGTAGATGQLGGLNIGVTAGAGTDGTIYAAALTASCSVGWTNPAGAGGCIALQSSTIQSVGADTFGAYFNAQCDTTTCRSLNGMEIDIRNVGGATQKDGYVILDHVTSVGATGTNSSAFLAVKSPSAVGFNEGLAIGRGAGAFPLASTGTAIAIKNGTAALGLDMSTMTFTTAAIKLAATHQIYFDANYNLFASANVLTLNSGSNGVFTTSYNSGNPYFKVGGDSGAPDVRVAGGGSSGQGAQFLLLKGGANIHQIGHASLVVGGGSAASNDLAIWAASSDAVKIYTNAGTLAATFASAGGATLNALTATSFNGNAWTAGTGTFTLGAGKTFTVSNSLTFTGTDSTSFAFPATSDTVVTLTAAQELTNKTLTASVGKGTWTASGTWTLPAFTLGGTVSGGGNQINNVIIGNSTPLAGSFTTLGASGVASFTNTTDATNTTTAGVVMSGGLAVAKTLYIGGNYHQVNATGDSLSIFETSNASSAARFNLIGTINGFNSIFSSVGVTNNWRIGQNSGVADSFSIYTGSSDTERARFDSTGLGVLLTVAARNGTATPAAASAVKAFSMGSAAVGVYWGTGSPNTVVTAPKGSLYIRTDGSTTNDRLYINTDGSTAWTNVTTAAWLMERDLNPANDNIPTSMEKVA